MKLLADLTGWGEQHLVVTTQFMYTVWRVPKSEISIPRWTVSTTMCSTKTPVNAHADRYEMALWLLALDVQSQLQHLIEVHSADMETASKKLDRFLQE